MRNESMPSAVPRRERGAWLADPAQPAARYRYLVEVEGRSPESAEARAERRQIPTRGWAAEILDEQDPRGFWKTRESLYRPKYVATNWRLLALADLGLTVRHPKVRRAVDLMLEDCGGSDGPFCRTGGEPHFCFVGNTARMMISFGLEEDRRVRASLDWLADQQLEDGGWDCFGRTKGTLDCWEALAAYAALGRRRWTRKWRHAAECGDDSKTKPARELLRRKMRHDGTWTMDAVHPDIARGANYHREPSQRFVLERVNAQSKWITLRALYALG